jgi:hypothetical protein
LAYKPVKINLPAVHLDRDLQHAPSGRKQVACHNYLTTGILLGLRQKAVPCDTAVMKTERMTNAERMVETETVEPATKRVRNYPRNLERGHYRNHYRSHDQESRLNAERPNAALNADGRGPSAKPRTFFDINKPAWCSYE